MQRRDKITHFQGFSSARPVDFEPAEPLRKRQTMLPGGASAIFRACRLKDVICRQPPRHEAFSFT